MLAATGQILKSVPESLKYRDPPVRTFSESVCVNVEGGFLSLPPHSTSAAALILQP